MSRTPAFGREVSRTRFMSGRVGNSYALSGLRLGAAQEPPKRPQATKARCRRWPLAGADAAQPTNLLDRSSRSVRSSGRDRTREAFEPNPPTRCRDRPWLQRKHSDVRTLGLATALAQRSQLRD